jgi:hypothetical protein
MANKEPESPIARLMPAIHEYKKELDQQGIPVKIEELMMAATIAISPIPGYQPRTDIMCDLVAHFRKFV